MEKDVTDYSNTRHWLSLPAHPSKSVDVFYVYPTAYHKVAPSEPDYARIDPAKGVVVCSSADEKALSGKFGRGVYHMWDYPLSYYNLRENAERRADRFLGK